MRAPKIRTGFMGVRYASPNQKSDEISSCMLETLGFVACRRDNQGEQLDRTTELVSSGGRTMIISDKPRGASRVCAGAKKRVFSQQIFFWGEASGAGIRSGRHS